MKVYLESVLPCPPEAAWFELQKSALLVQIARPLVTIASAGTMLPTVWTQGKTVRLKCYFLGWLPLGTRELYFERIDFQRHELQTRERDPLVQRWDHLISLKRTPDGATRYSDEVEIDAGPLTLVVWLFAQWFYRHRQRRWKRIARTLSR